MPASPRETGPVSAASPERSALSSAACSSGESTRPGSGTPARGEQVDRLVDERDQVVGAGDERGVVERAGRLGDPRPARRPARRPAPRRAAAACAGRSPRSWCRPAGRGRPRSPVNVIAGCMASVRAPARAAGRQHGERRARPRCARPAGPGARHRSRPVRRPAGRARRPGRRAAPGRPGPRPRRPAAAARRAAAGRRGRASRRRPPVAATMRWPAAARAAARTAPTRPVPITPTVSERARCGALMGDPVLEWGTGRGQGTSPRAGTAL